MGTGNSKRKLSSHTRAKAVVALILTFAAGYVDIQGFLKIYDVFTANMTGNTVHLAQRLVQNHRGYAVAAAWVLLAFVAGSVVGRVVIEVSARKGIQRVATITLLMEAGLIASVAVFAGVYLRQNAKVLLATLLAVAMGLQTATLTRVGPLTVHTTFVTGMINKLAQLISHALFVSWEIAKGNHGLREHRKTVLHQAGFILSIWLLYFAGAASGTAAVLSFGLKSLLFPAALLGVAAMVDQFKPLSLQEERDELEQAA